MRLEIKTFQTNGSYVKQINARNIFILDSLIVHTLVHTMCILLDNNQFFLTINN